MLVAFVLALLFAAPALAIDFPLLTGRVVDQADLLSPAQEAELTARLEALQRTSSRQLVVATVPSLQDNPIEDYGYQLGRAWRIGQQGANNGIILLVAPNERRVRIEVGYGLEPIVTDALSNQIIQGIILPRFRANDYPGGILAGADALIRQLGAPPEAQEQAAVAAQQAENRSKARGRHRGGGSIIPAIIWVAIFFFVILPVFGAGLAGRRYRGRGRRGVSVWGPGYGRRGDGGLGWFLAGIALSSLNQRGRGGSWGGGSSWGGGGGSWGGGGGGFSGGGGSFGGGGASGGW